MSKCVPQNSEINTPNNILCNHIALVDVDALRLAVLCHNNVVLHAGVESNARYRDIPCPDTLNTECQQKTYADCA